MFLRQFNRKCLTLSFFKIKAFNTTGSKNVNEISPIFRSPHIKINFNLHQFKRFYSHQTKIEELVVDYDYIRKSIPNKNTLLVDVREPEEIKEHGKIPNSINIPLGNVSTALNSMSDMEFEQTYGRKKPSEDTEIIFYCMIGKRSGMAQQNAIGLGFKNVKNYLGSWTDWASKTQ